MRLSKLLEEEDEVSHVLHLTSAQKKAALMVLSADDGEVAYDQITTGGEKVMTASDILVDLKVLERDEEAGSITLTDYGRKILRRDRLIDDTDQMTDKARKIMMPDEASASEPPPTEEPTF